jgi:hypothetical protein
MHTPDHLTACVQHLVELVELGQEREQELADSLCDQRAQLHRQEHLIGRLMHTLARVQADDPPTLDEEGHDQDDKAGWVSTTTSDADHLSSLSCIADFLAPQVVLLGTADLSTANWPRRPIRSRVHAKAATRAAARLLHLQPKRNAWRAEVGSPAALFDDAPPGDCSPPTDWCAQMD